MTNIRPVSDLRNNFAEISRLVHETNEPVYLTKNGYGDMVVMSIRNFDELKQGTDIYIKLREAEIEEANGAKWHSWDEVNESIDSIISEAEKNV